METVEDIGKRIKQIRDTLRRNPTQFSSEIGVPRTTLLGWEGGKTVPIETIPKLTRVYPQINLDWLIYGSGPMFLENQQPNAAHAIFDDKSDTVSDLNSSPSKKRQPLETIKSPGGSGVPAVPELEPPLQQNVPPPTPEGDTVPGECNTVLHSPADPASSPGKYTDPPPRRIRKISLELQGLADEIDVGGPIPARLRPLVRKVARLDDEDLTKTTAYVDDLLQKVKYAHGQEENADTPGAESIA